MKPYPLLSAICLTLCTSCAAYLPAACAMPTDRHEEQAELRSTEDLGTEYLDRMIFLGESTTAHLRSRSGLHPEQVWANESGTMKLDSTLLSRPIQDPISGNSITVVQAAELYRPEYLVLSFGLNGIMSFIQNRDSYLKNYRALIEQVLRASPDTRIIVQSVYPVARAESQTDWKFSVPPEQINASLQAVNGWLLELCRDIPSARFADTASVLYDGAGFLRTDYTTDGIHLTKSAYDEILLYLRTHGWAES